MFVKNCKTAAHLITLSTTLNTYIPYLYIVYLLNIYLFVAMDTRNALPLTYVNLGIMWHKY
jgi:hypothetical protein